jgi:hypothetical protein
MSSVRINGRISPGASLPSSTLPIRTRINFSKSYAESLMP